MSQVLKASLYFLIALMALSSCGTDDSQSTVPTQPSSEFRRYVAGFTSGVIARDGELSIVLQEPSKIFTEPGAELSSDLLEVNPALPGELYWKNDHTIIYTPSEKMRSGTRYEFVFELGAVLDVESRFADFPFSVYTQQQAVRVEMLNLKPYDDDNFVLNQAKGQVISADYLESEIVESMMSYEVDGNQVQAVWQHAANGRSHTFYVDSLERRTDARNLKVFWNLSEDGYEAEGALSFDLPSLNDFSYRDAKVTANPEQYLLVRFTDPIDKSQAIKGLVSLAGSYDLRTEIESNSLKIFPSSRLVGAQMLVLSKDIKNSLGHPLGDQIEVEIDFIERKPEIRLAYSGTILPSTDGKVYPFEAINLRAVDVEVKRVFENNIAQFLQVNEISGEYQLSRVGRTVMKRKVELSSDKALDYGEWNLFTLDLDELISQEPGAIYQIILSFRPSYSIYPCDVAVSDEAMGYDDTDDSAYDSGEEYYGDDDYYYDDYYYDDYYYRVPGFDWEERDNPCHVSYYVDRSVSQNILATDIGLIAKRGKDDKTYVSANDIRSTQPLSGVSIELFDYQQQSVGIQSTGPDGTVVIESKAKPYLIVAQRGDEKAYLKVGDGSALSTSNFNVHGAEVQQGLKGYIYGERGVWRPGDTLFLDFILEDMAQKLPEGHPVVMELTDPMGNLATREVRNQGVHGIYDFNIVTQSTAPTGMWTAEVKVGAARFYKRLSIEAVKPNRLKMNLDFGESIQETAGLTVGTLSANWLHGAVARDLEAEVAVVIDGRGISPPGHPDYIFKDPMRSLESSEEILFEGKIDHEGQAQVPVNFDLQDVAPGMLKAHFTTKVFEAGGGYSVDRFSVPYSPYQAYVGLRMPRKHSLEAGSAHTVPVLAVNKDGEPVHMSGLRVDVYEVSWRWWWDSGPDYLAQYIYDESRDRIQSFELDPFTGSTEFTLSVPPDEWSRYIVRLTDTEGGHSTGSSFYGYVPWRPGTNTQAPGGATMLSFEIDKNDYQVGETAKLTVPTGGTGRMLVTIEDGSSVLKETWVDVDREMMEYSFEVTPDMSPNAYAHITLLQPHLRENELPIRMYGVLPFNVEDKQTVLHPQIKMADELKPETTVSVKIAETDGRPMGYTLAIVDEGLLDLTGFKTPDPHSVFYAREALGVKTWDRYDDVIGAFGTRVHSLLSIGGDEELESEQENKLNRFKPMVRFEGPFHLKSGDTNEHQINIPNYVGSVRVMVVAAHEGAYGRAEKTVKVKKPLMVLATLPRVLGPEEEVRLPVSVFAMEEGIKQVSVDVKLNGPIAFVSESSQSLNFTEPEEKMLYFNLKTTSGTGAASATVTATGGGHAASYEIDIPVRQSRQAESRSELLVLEAGASRDLSFQHFAMPGSREVAVELSAMPAINLDHRLGYLTRYPHGCSEQTVSGAFPQLYLKDFLSENDEMARKRTENIMYVLSVLNGFQNGDGSFGTWPRHSSYNDWVTSYIGHFMLEAQRMGFEVPQHVYDKWLSWQKREVKSEISPQGYYGRSYYEKARSYRLFTLALAGSPDIAAMNRLKNSNTMDKPSLYMLAASYHMAGQTDMAQKLVADHPQFTPKNRRDGYSYSSVDRDKALILECMTIMDMKGQALPLVIQIAGALSSDNYMSTQTTAFSLRAILALDLFEKKDMDFSLSFNAQEMASQRTQATFKQYALSAEQVNGGQFSINNHSEGLLYARVVQTGIPSRDTQVASASNVDMQVRYLNMDDQEISIDQLEQGTEFIVDIIVSNPSSEDPLEDLALSVVLPSGWEPNIDRMDAPVAQVATDRADYTDIRDDRVLLYFDLEENDSDRYRSYRDYSKHFRFTVNASYSGSYFMPGVHVESMYDPEVYNRKKGRVVEVVITE